MALAVGQRGTVCMCVCMDCDTWRIFKRMTVNGRWAIRLKVKTEVDSQKTRLPCSEDDTEDSKIESFASDPATEPMKNARSGLAVDPVEGERERMQSKSHN